MSEDKDIFNWTNVNPDGNKPNANDVLRDIREEKERARKREIQRIKREVQKFNWNKHKSTIYDALYNAINTIKNKKQVITKQISSKYYRDFLRYSEALEELEKIK